MLCVHFHLVYGTYLVFTGGWSSIYRQGSVGSSSTSCGATLGPWAGPHLKATRPHSWGLAPANPPGMGM